MNSTYYRDDYELPPAPSIWHRLNRLLWVGLILTMVITVICSFLPEVEKQHNERVERERLHRLIDEQLTIHTRYENQIRCLQNDPEYLAIIARDRLGLMKEGETIFITEPAKPTPLPLEKPTPPTVPRSSRR